MRTHLLFLMAVASATLEFSALGQGATGSTTGSLAPTSGLRRVGFAVQDGVTYFIQQGRPTAVSESMMPPHQIMAQTGRLMPEGASDRGFVLENGTVYRVDGVVRQRVDTGLIPGGQMMLLDGRITTLPEGVTAFPGVQVITRPSNSAVPGTSEPN
jgi:hypothetical protein